MAKRKRLSGAMAGLLVVGCTAGFTAWTVAQEINPSATSVAKAAAAGELAESAAVSTPAETVSVKGIRIVRLSQVRGVVKLDRKTDRGYEDAFTNLPVVQGHSLQTAQGVAEVEFEDSSSLRLTPFTVTEFPVLGRSATGGTVTNVRLWKGTMYASLQKTKGNEFSVLSGGDKITLTPGSHVRLERTGERTRMSVLDGYVEIADAQGVTEVGKKRTVMLDESAAIPVEVAGKVERGPFDEWDKSEVQYLSLKSNATFGNTSPYSYGFSDLNYYGSYENVGGCGMMWRPYLASASFNPYATGTWAYYPGAGYSFVSPYPWGWAPFHYGSWSNCGGGWGWQPGGSWNGLTNYGTGVAGYAGAGSGATSVIAGKPVQSGLTLHPPGAPVAGKPTIVAVGKGPVAVSDVSKSGSFEFRQGSAGLGVPRGMVSNLREISAGVAQHGVVATPMSASVTASEAARGFSRPVQQPTAAYSPAMNTPGGAMGASTHTSQTLSSPAVHASGQSSSSGTGTRQQK